MLKFLILLQISLTKFVMSQSNSTNSTNITSLSPPLNWDCVKLSIPMENFTDPLACTGIPSNRGWSCCHFAVTLKDVKVNVNRLYTGGCIPVRSNITDNSTAYNLYFKSHLNASMKETVFVYTCEGRKFFFSFLICVFVILSLISLV